MRAFSSTLNGRLLRPNLGLCPGANAAFRSRAKQADEVMGRGGGPVFASATRSRAPVKDYERYTPTTVSLHVVVFHMLKHTADLIRNPYDP